MRQRARGRGDLQVAAAVDGQILRAVDLEGDGRRVRARTHDEVVLELLLVAVVNEVDSGIDVVIADVTVGDDAGPPLPRIAANQVVRTAGKLALRRGGRVSAAAGKDHGDGRRAGLAVPEHDRGAAGGQVQAVTNPARDERVRVLAGTALEAQRQPEIRIFNRRLRRRASGATRCNGRGG